MIPVRDVIPSRTAPVVTVGLIAVNSSAFLIEQSLSQAELYRIVMSYGLVPAWFNLFSLVTSTFLHAGWFHFGANMLYLWIFGDTVEDRMGHVRFLAFYLLCGTAAASAQAATNPQSAVPVIGASGAIAGVMGAYFVTFPQSRVLTLVPVFLSIDLVEIPAVFFLGVWFLMQMLIGVGSTAPSGGAFWAQAAGFGAGAALGLIFRRPERLTVDWVEPAANTHAEAGSLGDHTERLLSKEPD